MWPALQAVVADCLEISAAFCCDRRMKRLFPVIYVFSCLISAHSFAGSATWSANPVSNDWYTPENWVPATVPNGPGDIATIGRSSITAIVMPEQSVTELDSVIFEVGASITIPSGASLTFEGAGAIADGVSMISSQSGSSVAFHNSSVCEVYLSVRGQITFDGQATVSKSITCYGGDSTDEEGAVVFFLDQSAVTGYDMIVNDGIFGGKPSKVYFNDDSKADNVFFIVNGQGTVDISGHNPPGLAVATAGYFGGVVFLGSNNLTVTKNYQGSFSGLIQDDGLYGGSGGSLTKAGTSDDTLSLLSGAAYRRNGD